MIKSIQLKPFPRSSCVLFALFFHPSPTTPIAYDSYDWYNKKYLSWPFNRRMVQFLCIVRRFCMPKDDDQLFIRCWLINAFTSMKIVVDLNHIFFLLNMIENGWSSVYLFCFCINNHGNLDVLITIIFDIKERWALEHYLCSSLFHSSDVYVICATVSISTH